jgi:hypothetical protein
MADKKITELPFIDTLSGSLVGDNSPLQNTVIPLVLRGNTNQINIENFSKFVTAYSAHTGSAGNIFTGPQTINNNVTINGRLTVREVVAEYETASILFSTGSTKLGDELTDKHEFTGSTNITGSFFYNDVLVTNIDSNTIERLQQATASLQMQTGSQDLVNLGISSVTGSINTTTSSFDSVFLGISSVTGAINTTTSSFDSVFLGISYVTGAINTQSSSQDLVNLGISTYTGSQNVINSSIDSHILKQATQTGSQDLVNLGISTYTGSQNVINSSVDAHILKQSIQTGSQDLVNLAISTYTGSQNVINSSVDSHILGISIYTASANTTNTSIDAHILAQSIQTASQDLVNLGISTYTGSQNVINSSVDAHILKQATQTGSQDLVNLGISSVTGSLIGITNTLMAFTAALDDTYATDAQLLPLLQATASIQFATASLNTQTGSQDLVNLSISTYTGSQNVINNSFDSHILVQATQTGSQDLVNLGISTFTGSIRSEVGLIEAYTASLKGAAIVSSSTQISNYYKFAETASANIFYGNQTISGSLIVTASANLSGSVVINQLTYPTADFADGQYGVEVPTLAANNVFSMEIPKTIYEYVKNDSGVTLLKGTPVHSTGTVGFNTLVIAASASNASTMPATYILAQDLDDEEEGLGIAIGAIQGVDTTGLIAGDAVYVGTNGGFTQTKPTGSNLIQNLGIVTKVGVNGGGVVLGAGRSNDVPNIQEGYFWVGNSGSVATATPTSSFELSGRGVISGSNQLPQIAGLQEYTASLKGAIEVSGQNVNVLGMITAQQFNVTYVSSSILFQSGSTKFGDTSDDTHEFTGSVSISGSFLVNGTEVGVAAGPNTFDFNLDPEAAGTVNFIQDSTGNTLAIARTGSFDIEIEETQYLSLSPTEMLITTGSITANYMHLAKYINSAGDLDFNI